MSKKYRIALTLNSIILAFGILGTFFTFADVKITMSFGTASGVDSLKYYTVLSNIAATFLSGVAIVYEYRLLKGKIMKFGKTFLVCKFSATVCVSLTFVIVMLYLAPFNPDGFFAMFTNSNVFFHFLIPILSVVVFVFYEKGSALEFKYTFYSVFPTIIYGTAYAVNAALNTANGEVIPEHDWYRFFYGGTTTAVILYAVITVLCYSISFLLWKANGKRHVKK